MADDSCHIEENESVIDRVNEFGQSKTRTLPLEGSTLYSYEFVEWVLDAFVHGSALSCIQENMQMELLSHNKSTMIHSKHAKGVIANDKNDPSAAHYIVEGMDAIDDTIPFTFLQLATYLPPEPINAVEKIEVVIRHPEQVGHSSKSSRHYFNE
eukprot:scaffold9824_cov130-Skeletonema_dohrnii-CCMP3373.AAC.1